MNLIRLSWRNLLYQPLSTLLSLLLLTVGAGLIALLLLINKQVEHQLNSNLKGIDMVVGAKGSPLQLVLASVYHIDAPTGNILLKDANRVKKNRHVKSAIPLAYGDSYKGYRIVGTEAAYPELYGAELGEGRFWKKDLEVTVGSGIANRLGLKVGDHFHSTHGMREEGEVHDNLELEVVGIFKPTQSVIDNLILTNVASLWKMHDHPEEDHGHEGDSHEAHEPEAHEHADHDHGEHENEGNEHESHEEHSHDHEGHDHEGHDHEEEDRQITALLVKFRSPMGMFELPRTINEKTSMQAALPVIEMDRLFNLMGVGLDTLRALAYIIVILSGISVFIALYNSLKDRRYELALMRAQGATPKTLLFLILLEGMILALGGYVMGWILSRLGMVYFANLVDSKFHYQLEVFDFHPEEGWLFLGILGLGILAALLPAMRAYSMNISRTLAEN